jgi:hypothetical protein
MSEPIPIAQKLGCDKHAIDSCILVKTSVVLTQLLNADVITFFGSDNAVFREFKVFRQDRLVEHYLFGSECDYLLPNYREKASKK